MKQLSDQQLVVLARQQLPYSTSGYEVLMARHEHALFSLCRNLCGNIDDAEDAYQEVLLQVFHNLKKFRGDSSFKTWIYRISYNESMSLIRKRKPQESLDAIPEELVPLESNENNYEPGFHQLIAQLPEEDRTILALRFISDFDFQEIAHITHSGLSAVKMRYKRALDKIKIQLEKTIKKRDKGLVAEDRPAYTLD